VSAFDLFPAEAATKLESGHAADLNAGAGVLEGAATAPLTGLAAGATGFARTLNLGLSPIAGAVDEAFGTNTRDWWFQNMMLERTARKVAPNPRETGVAGQILHSLFDVGGQAVTLGPAGVLVSKTIEKSMEGVEQGLDVSTAMQKGAIEGGGAALGVALPIAMPYMVGSRIPGLLQQIGYGVGTNVPLGIASRALTHKVLEDAGYRDMAEQYKALDESGLMTDVVLGTAFGALGHAITAKGAKLPVIRPADIDAALAKRNAYHLEVDTAPGLARNGETRDAHVDAVLKATEDLMEGRPVDVAAQLKSADFQPNPDLDRARMDLVRAQWRGNVEALPITGVIRDMSADFELLGRPKVEEALKDMQPDLARVFEVTAKGDEAASMKNTVRALQDKVAELQADPKKIFDVAMRRPEILDLIDRARQALEVSKAAPAPTEKKAALGGAKEPLGAAPKLEEVHTALKSEGLETSSENVAKVQQIARARALDAAAVDAIPDRTPDGEYMAKIAEIIDAKQSTQAADKGGAKSGGEGAGRASAEARPEGQAIGRRGGEAKPGSEDTRHIDEAEVRAAEAVAEQYPEMFVTLDDGTVVPAHEAMAAADAAIAKAQSESKAFDAAVACALRVGE
jgi:hypothetical protein